MAPRWRAGGASLVATWDHLPSLNSQVSGLKIGGLDQITPANRTQHRPRWSKARQCRERGPGPLSPETMAFQVNGSGGTSMNPFLGRGSATAANSASLRPQPERVTPAIANAPVVIASRRVNLCFFISGIP